MIAPSSIASAEISQLTDHPIHVVHVIEGLGPGGAERLLYTNLKHFDTTRIRSTVVTLYPQANYWVEPIRELGVPVISLECAGPRDLPRAIMKLFRWLRANGPDLVHSHLWAANVIARVAGRLAGVPVVSSIHNPDHDETAWSDGANVSLTKRRVVKSIDRWTARFGNKRLIAVSEYVRQSAHRHLKFPLKDIDLLYNPIDIDALTANSSKSPADLLHEINLPADALMLLNVARVSPQKGLIYAVRALPKIISEYPTAHLVSLGGTTDPAWLDELKREAKQLNVESHFHILGPRRDVPDFLHACDLFVFPSLYEGLGIALIEAMASGCVCLATTAGPIPEFLEPEREGFLVSPKDADAIAAAVCELLSNPERSNQMSLNAAHKALEKFQPQAAADRLTQIYEDVLHITR
jgi:glycosyltransferase involved in cell wall biosynthesis